jgi:MoaA/NifB/PqqE/SkfB family radical SAM enzyme
MDKATILRTIGELRRLGVFWLGFTGGEPLLNRDIVEITRAAAEKEIALKLFTTGLGLTPNLAAELREAGLFSVSVSLDHWEESVHDRVRGFKGAYRAALQAIATLLAAGGLHVGVSAVLSKEMIASGDAERFLEFLSGLEVHEAWLSETKPAVLSGPKIDLPTHEERLALIRLQDRWNRRRGLTVNYLAHFESGRHFGCNAGRKMIYIDPFGEVSPCVFAPLSFGNVGRRPLAGIYEDMKKRFASSGRCFVNAHAGLFGEYGGRGIPLPPEESRALLESASFGRPSRFFRIFRTKKG